MDLEIPHDHLVMLLNEMLVYKNLLKMSFSLGFCHFFITLEMCSHVGLKSVVHVLQLETR